MIIGERFNKVVIKLALLKLFENFSIETENIADFEVAHSPAPVIKSDNGGFKIKLITKDPRT